MKPAGTTYDLDVIMTIFILIFHMPKDSKDGHLFFGGKSKSLYGLWFMRGNHREHTIRG